MESKLSIFANPHTSNLILAITNFTSVFPFALSLKFGDWLTAGVIFSVNMASVVSHLAERFFGLDGILNVSQNAWIQLNNVDRVCAWTTGLRFGYLYYQKHGLSLNPVKKHPWDFVLMLIPFIFGGISILAKYSGYEHIYVFTHAIWHIGIYLSMYHFLNTFVYGLNK